MTEAPRTVWVTKYALTDGIAEKPFIMGGGGVAWTGVVGDADTLRRYEEGEWADTREAALARAEEMRAAKIASLKRQIERLESLEF